MEMGDIENKKGSIIYSLVARAGDKNEKGIDNTILADFTPCAGTFQSFAKDLL